jgi:glucokinase
VFIAGGIIPKLGEAFALSSFRQHFDDKGIYTELMKTIPTMVITHPHPAFVGLSSMVLNRT